MFKKELADILKQTGWFLIAVCLLPAPLILLHWVSGPYFSVLVPVFQAGLFIWSLFLGASIFGRERRQRAMEYALSFPYSRHTLLDRLVLPRAIVLTALVIASWFLKISWGAGALDLHPLTMLCVYYLPLFLISLSLSALIENFIALSLISLVGWFGSGWLIFQMLRGRQNSFVDLPMLTAFSFSSPDLIIFNNSHPLLSFFLQIVLPLIPFIFALLISFSRFDIRRSAAFAKRYLTAFVSSFILCALIAFIGRAAINPPSRFFHLTKDLKLVEWRANSNIIEIHENGSTQKARLDSPILNRIRSSWDENNFYYFQDNNGNLQRIDLSTGREDLLYQFDRKQSSDWNQWNFGSTLACFENGSRPDEIQLVLLNGRTKQVDRRVYVHRLFNRGTIKLIGTSLQDKSRFWICSISHQNKTCSLRLWDTGRVEEISVKGQLETVDIPQFVNGYLIYTGKQPTLILQDDGKSFQLLKEFPADEAFSSMQSPLEMSLDPPAIPFFYGKRGSRLARMNMETLEIENIGEWSKADGDAWGWVTEKMGRFYFYGGSQSRKTREFYDLSEGRMQLVRSFPDMDISQRDTSIQIYESGIVLTQRKWVGIYAFPDLRELKFKGINNRP